MLLLTLLYLFLHDIGAHSAFVNQGCGMSPSKSLCPKTHLNTRSGHDGPLHVLSPERGKWHGAGSAPGGMPSEEERGAKPKKSCI